MIQQNKTFLAKLKGIIPFHPQPLPLKQSLKLKNFPQPFHRFPLFLILVMFLSSTCKILLPFTLQFLYHRISQENFLFPLSIFMAVLIGSYYLEMLGEKLITRHKLNVRKVLTERLIDHRLQTGMEAREKNSLWTKVTSNINLYVDNYYSSCLSLVFETGKVVVIVIYLLYQLGVVLIIGLFLTGAIVHFTLFLAQHIQISIFANVKLKERKVQTLRDYLSRVVDFKMAWLDGFVGSRIREIQKLYQVNLRKNKMLDCWCVGLWQFTTIGISSIVLCCYYGFGMGSGDFQPATIIYLFQLLTFPMNVISWNINGMNNATQAISELTKEENSPKVQNQQQMKEKQNSIIIPSFKENSSSLQLQKNKVYSVVSDQQGYLKELALFLAKLTSLKISYAQQNGWHLPSLFQSLFLKPQVSQQQIEQNYDDLIKLLEDLECEDIPLQNSVLTYSGGEKMRVSLVRAFLLGDVVIIDSDLRSLDEKTREKVLKGISMMKKEKTILLKGKEKISDYELVAMKGKEIKLKANKNVVFEEKESCIEKRNILKEKLEKLMVSRKNKKSGEESEKKKKPKVSFDTFKYYYKSPKHIWFLISLFVMVAIGNYYNYYISINTPDEDSLLYHVLHILVVTFFYVFFIALRSFLFAEANLQESTRICNQTNDLVCYNQVYFYDENSQQNLTYTSVSDEETVGAQYPFTTNIFFNNLSTVLGSLVMIGLQVPSMVVISAFLYFFILNIDKSFRAYNQHLKSSEKEEEVRLYESINNIEQSASILKIFKHESYFKNYFNESFQTVLNLNYRIFDVGIWVRKNYRIMMIGFMAIATVLFGLFRQGKQSKENQAGLALLVRYILTLSDYIFYFTMSLADSRNHAVSIERIRHFAENKKYQKSALQRRQKVEKQVEVYRNTEQVNPIDVSFENLNFAYSEKGQIILKNINLSIKDNSQLLLRGKSGAGKTTLCKLLTGLFDSSEAKLNKTKISFSSQHPLLLKRASILENVDPYNIINQVPQKIKKKVMKVVQPMIEKVEKINAKRQEGDLSYEQKVLLNNARTYLYSFDGLGIYDEPVRILDEKRAYLVITHHKQFACSKELELIKGELVEKE